RRRCSMRWTMILGALVVSAGLSSQSYGFELLDRMLGISYGGGSCCEKPCGEAYAPACGCGAAEACNPCCQKRCGLFHGLFSRQSCCPTQCEPACGAVVEQ